MERDPIARWLRSCLDLGWMPGASWAVGSERGPTSSGAIGVLGTDPPMGPVEPATPYDLASLTKPLATATLLVLLEQEGGVDLERRVDGFLAELAGSVFAGASLLALATHTAGLPAWHPLYLAGCGIEAYLAGIARLPRACAPGQTLYSDLGYILLGAVLERVAGEPLDRLFVRRIATPLRLGRLGYATDPSLFADAAPTEHGNAFERRKAGPAGARHPWREELLCGEVHDGNAHGLGGVAGHAGLFGDAASVARLGAELLDGTALGLLPFARRRLLEPAEGAERSVGFVMAAHAGAARGILAPDAPGHTGFTGTSLWIAPDAGAVYVLLTNRVHPAVEAREFRCVRRAFHRLAAGTLCPRPR